MQETVNYFTAEKRRPDISQLLNRKGNYLPCSFSPLLLIFFALRLRVSAVKFTDNHKILCRSFFPTNRRQHIFLAAGMADISDRPGLRAKHSGSRGIRRAR